MKRFSRREMFRGLGVGAALLGTPFVRVLNASADPLRPVRLVMIITTGGQVRESWGTRHSDTQYEFGDVLEPFAPMRDRMLILDGLDMSAATLGPGGGHQRGPGVVLTGQSLLDGDFCGGIGCVSGRSGWAAGPSLDQVLAEHLAGTTRLRSLEMGVRILGSNNRHRISYRAANDPVPPDDDPFHVYQRLFSGADLDRTQLERQRRERGSVLDLVGDDLTALHQRLGVEHRGRLDAHLQSVRELERQMDAALTASVCEAPEAPRRFDHRRSGNYPLVSRLQLDLLATALACDSTRVASVFYSGGNSYQTFPWIGVGDQHHALSHEGDSNLRAKRKLTLINAWYAQEIMRFVQRLASIPEGDGDLLSHTIVVWGNEVSKGNTHSHDNMFFVLFGGERAGVQPGRWLRFEDRMHNDLLVSLARAMGHRITRFGHPDCGSGPLTATGLA